MISVETRHFGTRLLFSFLFCLVWTLLQSNCSWAGTDAKAKAGAGAAAKTAAPTKSSGLPQIIDFGAKWCVPCRKFAPVFDKVGANYKGKIDFVHCDVESKEGEPLATKYKVGDILPVIMFIDAKGKVVSRLDKVPAEADLVKNAEALIK